MTLRQHHADTNAASLLTAGRSLVAIHDWTFLLGPALILGVNTLLLASLMYRSGLVPRFIAVLGLIGGPLICASATAVMFGLCKQTSVAGTITAIPVSIHGGRSFRYDANVVLLTDLVALLVV